MNGWTLLARETFCYGVWSLALGLGLAATLWYNEIMI